ncbi:hypothetical protein JCM24511_02656 [Saitozyma sp. JCM 24511]|nr:hypothetical protein JCM24511_02656 [Saitozyma sp. JCM 24511]
MPSAPIEPAPVEDDQAKDDVFHAEQVAGETVGYDEKAAALSGRNVRNVYNADLYEAVQNAHLPRWGKTTMQFYFAVFVTFCCSCANGYDGSLFTAFVSDRWGRRVGMFCGAWFITIGMIITAASTTIPVFAVGRFILGFGIHFMTIAAPSYTMEISPPHWRGRCTGLYNCGYYGGAIPAAAVTFGCNFLQSNWSWRVPLILQAFACTIVILFVFTIPESPRWLMANGREEEAIEYLIKYHAAGDRNSKLVQLELSEFRQHIAQNGADKRWWDYRPLVFTHNGRWRMAQVLMMSIAGQFSGNGLSYYNTVIYKQLGVTTVSMQLAYNLLYNVVAAIGAFSGAFLSDRMPRRKVLISGTLICAGLLAINAGLQLVIGKGMASHSVYAGALASYFLFGFVFMFSYTPLQAVVPTEALETTIRAKGLALAGVVSGCMGFINTFAGPIGLANIGYRYVWVFVGWDTFEGLMWYLFGVESQGKTLEELNWIYDQPNPVKASLKTSEVVVADDGTVVAGADEL